MFLSKLTGAKIELSISTRRVADVKTDNSNTSSKPMVKTFPSIAGSSSSFLLILPTSTLDVICILSSCLGFGSCVESPRDWCLSIFFRIPWVDWSYVGRRSCIYALEADGCTPGEHPPELPSSITTSAQPKTKIHSNFCILTGFPIIDLTVMETSFDPLRVRKYSTEKGADPAKHGNCWG